MTLFVIIHLRRYLAALGLALLAVGLVSAGPSVPAPAPFNALKPQVVLKVGGTADWVSVTSDAVWVGSTGPNAVHRIDPRRDRLAASVVLPGEPCAGLATGFGALWVPLCGTKPGLARVSMKTNRLIGVLPFGPAAEEGGIATSADSVWIVTDRKGALARIDPTTSALRQTVTLPPGSYNLLHSKGVLYATRVEGSEVTAVDAASGRIIATIPTGPHPRFLTAGGGAIWTLNQGDGTLTRINAKSRTAVATIALNTPGHGGDIAFARGVVWTTMMKTPLTATVAATNRVLRQWIGQGGDSLNVGHGAIWLTDYHGGTVSRIPFETIEIANH